MLSLSDVMIDSRSTLWMDQLTLRQSKKDVFGAGVKIYLGRTGNTLCPVSGQLAYLAIRSPTPGPLFLLKSGDPLSQQALVSAIRLTLFSAGLDISLFNSQGFRFGAATATAQAGIPDLTIKLLGRWKSSAFTRYLCLPVQIVASSSSHLLQGLSSPLACCQHVLYYCTIICINWCCAMVTCSV